MESKVDTKKLKLGTNKCFKMHVGSKQTQLCPNLYVSEEKMKTTSSEKYLGDLLTNDNKIDKNIEARYKKGVGVVNSIFAILQEVTFGHYFFEIALLFRSSMLINSILCSSEVLYGIKQKHIQVLEKCDKLFFSKLFQVPMSCPYEAYFFRLRPCL